jgi:hypothetical protein
MKTCSLVSRTWRNVIAPLMWETFSTDLQALPSSKQFSALIHPESGILPHVRTLNVLHEKDGELKTDDETNNRLRLLIAAIPRERLRGFKCPHLVPLHTMQLLLQCHRSLESLWTACPTDRLASEESTWMVPLFSSVDELTTTISGNTEEISLILQNCLSQLKLMPKLKTFRIHHAGIVKSRLQGRVDLLPVFSGLTSGAQISHLTTLDLDSVDLATSANILVQNLNTSVLHTIELQRCRHMALFLNGMSDRFTASKGALVNFALYSWDDGEQSTMDAVERFLRTCPSLSDLFLDKSGSTLVDRACVRAHHKTLASLSLLTSHWPLNLRTQSCYSAQDLDFMLERCSKIKLLALDLPLVDLGHLNSSDKNF